MTMHPRDLALIDRLLERLLERLLPHEHVAPTTRFAQRDKATRTPLAHRRATNRRRNRAARTSRRANR